MHSDNIKLEASWRQALHSEFAKPYMQSLKDFLQAEKAAGKTIYPPASQYFAALDSCPLPKVKVVIIGQDPYHGPGQAHGLCFSVLPGVKPPPSLKNIYKELAADLGIQPPDHGCLSSWAEQGVLLLNTVLSVEAGNAGSHQGRGWEMFTDKIIEVLNNQEKSIIFVLWGAHALKKGAYIDPDKHQLIKSTHPSPFSAHRGFLGSRPFSKINQLLRRLGEEPINWQLPEHPKVVTLRASTAVLE